MYIVDLYSISAQQTHDGAFERGVVTERNNPVFEAIEPNYSSFIPAALLRRMGKAVRMGVGAGLPLIGRNAKPHGIIIGTANGGMENCINFLNQIVEYEEGMLTPTNFVQSTPNAIAGQLALLTENTGYNVTHVNGSLAFENALVDAMLYLEQKQTHTLLVGAVEEISDYNYNIDLLSGRFKTTIDPAINPRTLETYGSICGEGASMFVVSGNADHALARIVDVQTICHPEQSDLELLMEEVLGRNGLKASDIDLLALGKNGDIRTDHWYSSVQQRFFPTHPVIYFKDLVGEYRTVSGFAVYLCAQLLCGKLKTHTSLPELAEKQPERILIYNHFDGHRHGIILMERVK